MKEAPRTAPLATALRVKDFARDLAKDVATDLADGYRKSTRYMKLRGAVIGVWAALSLASLWIACPGSGPRNALGAEVHLVTQGLMGTQLSVLNDSDTLWADVTLTLDDTWRYTTPTLRAKERVVLAVARFTREGGGAAPGDLIPRALVIRCSEGKVSVPLAKAP